MATRTLKAGCEARDLQVPTGAHPIPKDCDGEVSLWEKQSVSWGQSFTTKSTLCAEHARALGYRIPVVERG